MCVIGSIIYGFRVNGFHYIEKYIPYKGMGIVTVTKWYHWLLKPLDIAVGLFIGLIELIGEVAKILSLSLRLFGNILAGMVLLGMIITAAQSIFHVPALMPLLVFLLELLVSVIQAFVFSTLVLVYFRMA
jgi:F-type H+-transporting ATPase subunit a